MRVLVIGGTGLIGSHVVRALRTAGCTVLGASRRRPPDEAASDWIELDFGAMTQEQDWLALLDGRGIDAVVNCVGIIRESRPGDFDRLHRAAPVALFGACERLGIVRVVQLSALGSHPDAATGYWRSKGAAEADLLARPLAATVIRPSLVYGEDGASSVMFRMLATLPVLMMPAAHRARVQPVHVADLADIVCRLVTGPAGPRELAVVGPRASTMAGYLGELRRGMAAPAGLVLELPQPVARLMARVAALIPSSALTPESLLMLEQSADGSNTADPAPAQALLGRPLRDPARFARPAERVTAAWQWGAPLVTFTMALLWLITACVSWFAWPQAQSLAWLAACGVPAALQEPLLLAASLTDAAIGVALLVQLWRPQRWLWLAQLLLVGGYTVVLSVFLPGFWAHPFGPLTKNLPLLAIMAVLWRLTPGRRR